MPTSLSKSDLIAGIVPKQALAVFLAKKLPCMSETKRPTKDNQFGQ